MTAMTPIRYLRVKGNEIYTEDYAGNRTLVATCPTYQLNWVVQSIAGFHKSVQVLEWDERADSVDG